MKCNLCGGEVFIDMGSRKNVRCRECGSLERTRLLWMYLRDLQLDKQSRVLHLAPEKGLYKALSKRLTEKNYVVADINPKRYPFAGRCRRIDLCDLERERSFEYDLIIHSHVLEHIPCNIAYTLFHLHRMLKRSGFHICVIPFMAGKYEESFQDLSEEERTRRFGQYDHIRRFGKEDVGAHLGKLLNITDGFDATKDFTEQELRNANIPQYQWKGFNISTVFSLRRNDMKLLGEQAEFPSPSKFSWLAALKRVSPL